MVLQRSDLPASQKPDVTKERSVFLKRVLNACNGFNIPLLVELLEVDTPEVHTNDMCATGYHYFNTQTKGGNNPPMSSKRIDSMRNSLTQRREGSVSSTKNNRKAAIGVLFRALKAQHKLYGRTMGQVRETFYKRDLEKMGNLSTAEFRSGCLDLGLGISQSQMTALIASLDTDGQGIIGYDEVLKPLHMEFAVFNVGDVPATTAVSTRKNNRYKVSATVFDE